MPDPDEPADHRARLLAGMACTVTRTGYAGVTIADIVREAGVSRRTFYEHFDTKAGCLIALYELASAQALERLRAAVDRAQPWPQQVEQAVSAYLGHLANRPQMLRTLLVDILGLGEPGLAARRRVNRQIARFMLDVVNGPGGGTGLQPELATAVVGGIHELVLQAIETDPEADLTALVAPASALVRAVAQAAHELPAA